MKGVRVLVFTAVLSLLAGCPKPEEQSVVINHRDVEITLTYGSSRYGGIKPACEIVAPALGRAEDVDGGLDWGDWNHQPHYQFDAATCEISVVIPPHGAAWIGVHDSCGLVSDGGAPPPQYAPLFKQLRVQSADGVAEYTGWETARAFALQKHLFSRNVCRLDLR